MPVNSDGSVDMEDLKTLARNNITLAKLLEKQGSVCLEVLEKLQNATDVAVTEASVHENLTDIMALIIMGLTLASLSLMLLGRRLSLTSTTSC